MLQKHEIDFRTDEQFEGDKTKEFLDKINELQEQYERSLVPKLNYQPQGVFPIIFAEVKKKEEKPEEKK
mgnify:CR=1 FL=1